MATHVTGKSSHATATLVGRCEEKNGNLFQLVSFEWSASSRAPMMLGAYHHTQSVIRRMLAPFIYKPEHTFTSSDAVVMGHTYSSDADGRDAEEEQNEAVQARIQQVVWMTYRHGFPYIGGSIYCTDAGWGCMLRTLQMLLAEAMQRVNPGAVLSDVIRPFMDREDEKHCPLSIHSMLSRNRREPGRWFGPFEVSFFARRCVNTWNDAPFRIVMAQEGMIFRGDLYAQDFKPVLVLIPLRLGSQDYINPIYSHLIKQLLAHSLSVGIIGGKPNSSFYFVGSQDDQILYLDPHTVQNAVDDHLSSENIASYTAPNVLSIPVNALDPCVSVGFLCSFPEQLDELWDFVKSMAVDPYNVLSLSELSFEEFCVQLEHRAADASVVEDEEDEGFTILY